MAPPGSSLHEKGRAFDMIGTAEELAHLGREWRKMGGVWGGRADPIHFEYRRGLSLAKRRSPRRA